MQDEEVMIKHVPDRVSIEDAACFLLRIQDEHPSYLLEIYTLMNLLDEVHRQTK